MARAAHTLEACQALLYVAATDTADLDAEGDASAPAAYLQQALNQLDRMISMVREWIGGAPVDHAGAVQLGRVLVELYELRHEADDELMRVRQAMLRGVAASLQRLAAIESAPQLLARAPVDLCAGAGFDRCLLFRVRGTTLALESLHFAREPEWQSRVATELGQSPPVLDVHDPEAELLRRRRAILVTEPRADGHGMGRAIDAWASDGYVAAPILVRGTVIGMVQADRHFSELRVDEFARDLLAAFCAGFGAVVERALLLDRTRVELHRMHQAMASTETSMRELLTAGASLRGIGRESVVAALRESVVPPADEARAGTVLTRRELEVVELLAQGASNADIAASLVISPGTVKSHVKHILRKLRAANRAQAVSTYMRVRAGPPAEGGEG